MKYSDASSENFNQSYQGEFILLGVADRPLLEMLLFAVILICYTMSLLGNTTIMVLFRLDPNLHTPMYFFISNLSFLDLCLTTSIGPQMLVNFWRTKKTITYTGCALQMCIFLFMGSTECILLSVMAYDRYAAVCQPLRYTAIMSPSLCFKMAVVSWVIGFGNAVAQTVVTLKVPLCGQNQVDHFFCEVPAFLKLACADTSLNEAMELAACIFLLAPPLSLIIVFYSCIAGAVMRIRSAEGKYKAFNTCASHLIVISLFYGPVIFNYFQPSSNYSSDTGKMMSLFYMYGTPMLNPLIYTLRNKEVHRALKKAMKRNATI